MDLTASVFRCSSILPAMRKAAPGTILSALSSSVTVRPGALFVPLHIRSAMSWLIMQDSDSRNNLPKAKDMCRKGGCVTGLYLYYIICCRLVKEHHLVLILLPVTSARKLYHSAMMDTNQPQRCSFNKPTVSLWLACGLWTPDRKLSCSLL